MNGFDYTGVAPELRTAARLVPRSFGLQHGLRGQRAALALLGRIARRRETEVAAVNDVVHVRIHRPCTAADRHPAMLWIHGGGTVMGTAEQEDTPCRTLANHTDVAVVAVNHRLAPEYPYPTPLEDCYAALVWLTRQPWVDPERIGVGGPSAGGGFTAALAQLAHDRGEVRLSLQLMAHPMLDDRSGNTPTAQSHLVWTGRDNRIAWRNYLAGADPDTAVPARRADLSGLAPAWIGVGTLDLFYEESVEYARRLRDAGVPVTLEVVDGGFHVSDMLVPKAAVSQRFFASQCRAVRAALVADDTNSSVSQREPSEVGLREQHPREGASGPEIRSAPAIAIQEAGR